MKQPDLRRRSALVLTLLLAWLPLTNQARDLSKGWCFMTGDDIAWAQPEFDDSAWEPIKVGKPWEKAGHEGYDGYGWYRLRVSLPKTESEGAYFNGVEVGRAGSAPNDTTGYHEAIRRYEVSAQHIRRDALIRRGSTRQAYRAERA